MKKKYLKTIANQLIVSLLIILPISAISQFTQIGQNIDGIMSGDYSGFSVSMNNNGTRVVIGELQDLNNIDNTGQVKIFELENDNWVQIGQIIEGNENGSFFGFSVSMNGDGSVIAIGSIFETPQGRVSVYKFIEGTWVLLGNYINGQVAGDRFGNSVGLNNEGNIVVVGSPDNDGNGNGGGRTRVFKFENNNWSQLGQSINGEFGLDRSGRAVCINSSGERIAIGAMLNNGNGSNSGHVRIYDLIENNWVKFGQDINGEFSGDLSGRSVSLNSTGDIVAIGAADNDANGVSSGHVRIFKQFNNSWIQIGNDIDGENQFDNFGRAVSLNANGNVVAIGTSFTSPGLVKVFQLIDNLWVQVDETLFGNNNQGGFGFSVSLSNDGNRVGIGAPFNNHNGTQNSGRVKIFETENIIILSNINKSKIKPSIYPNPTNSILFIDFPITTQINNLSIYDIFGKQSITKKDPVTNSINVSKLTSGIYILNIETTEGVFKTKVIKK